MKVPSATGQNSRLLRRIWVNCAVGAAGMALLTVKNAKWRAGSAHPARHIELSTAGPWCSLRSYLTKIIFFGAIATPLTSSRK